jgi:general secretion pathway protein K
MIRHAAMPDAAMQDAAMQDVGRQRGFVLLAVLWASMMLAIIVASILSIGRTEALIAHSRTHTAALEATLDAAINQVILRMLDRETTTQPPTDGTVFAEVFDGLQVRVSVQDETGKIDLNMASSAALTRLLEIGGLAADDAQTMADRIQDWREPGDLHRLGGAGEDAYSDAGTGYGPRRGPFPNVAELQLVLGMDKQVFARVAPSLTVASGMPWIDPTYAGHDVLLALPGATEDSVAVDLAARGAATPPGVVIGHAFTITAAVADHALHMMKRAIIRLTGSRNVPVWVYSWDRVTEP